jgi:hypothetical protein
MNGRPWTKREEIDVTRWFRAGMTIREISTATERTYKAIESKLCELGINKAKGTYITISEKNKLWAYQNLQAEIKAAKAEMRTAPPLDHGKPLEW